jgi:hypothetical protein
MDDLTRRMSELGAPDPATWARSEADENIPQQARYLFLRALWPRNIDAWGREEVIRRIPAGARLLASGASSSDLATLVRAVAYEVTFAVVEHIDEGIDEEAPDDAPGWALIETDAEGEPTGRHVGGLHEDLLTLDPSGREGSDLRQ